ncbi:hypothetical protein [Gloeobacter violaceus]|uniref:Gsr1835 protein n=1 Tax=Gloeobacter violaceus (strain ATCC 29082 / PCC 7421) TaxID=251221 RepID=Q7NJJ7_GLOVI|nr:hypothetical protein [Gloeobacter violaceus]BAC89776.1 gsr1835 [Gloeobacter violaceus PCC 7421]
MSDEMHADRIEGMPEPVYSELDRCGEVDVLEAAITLKRKLKMVLKGSDEHFIVMPIDLETRDGTEFLHYEADLERRSVDINTIATVEVFEVE